MKRPAKLNKKTRLSILTIVAVLLIVAIIIYNKNLNAQYFRPDYKQEDVTSILNQEYISEEDYEYILKQTGLGKDVIDTLLQEQDGIEEIKDYQANFFGEREIVKDKINLITNEDKYISNSSGLPNTFPMENIKDGYILITTSTFTAGYRHGHAGLVIDAENGIVLESLEPGTVSKQQKLEDWLDFPNVIILKLKGVPDAKHAKIADYASSHLRGYKYNLFSSKNKGVIKEKTYCSLLIWQAFKEYGYNLDSDKGFWVTPEDIGNSDLLEVVYASGVDPINRWN
ncbi:MAG: hypothetical protein K0R15_458 [Clostridiales bacterium]|jgi:uncharacterized protein YycO|nr:hypothetical protein [Clostridiales bacterium]